MQLSGEEKRKVILCILFEELCVQCQVAGKSESGLIAIDFTLTMQWLCFEKRILFLILIKENFSWGLFKEYCIKIFSFTIL